MTDESHSNVAESDPGPKTSGSAKGWRHRWSIGIYSGPTPLALAPHPAFDPPVLAPEAASDISGCAVADPFLLRRDGAWHMFFEVYNSDTGRGEVGHATSPEGFTWRYNRIVLREPFHLSYPYVFEWRGEVWMVPESRQSGCVRLYRSIQFPETWRFFATLIEGPYADSTLTQHEGRWWMFAQRGLDELRLFYADKPIGPWRAHATAPLIEGCRRRTRPAGRMVEHRGQLIRFSQDGLPAYGTSVRAFQVDCMTPDMYREHELAQSPILSATGSGWNAMGMHHIDAVERDDGSWWAAVDGATVALF